MTYELSQSTWNRLVRVARSWLQGAIGQHDPRDVVQDAIVRAYENEHRKPKTAAWDDHVVAQIIYIARGLRQSSNSPASVPHWPLETALDVPLDDAPRDDYNARRELREFTVQTILGKMSSKRAALLKMYYLYGQDLRAIGKFYKVSKQAIHQQLMVARHEFIEVAESLGLSVTQANVEPGSTWPGLAQPLPTPADWTSRAENKTDPTAFLGPDGELARFSGQEPMKLRVAELRRLQTDHSTDAPHCTDGPQQTEKSSSDGHGPEATGRQHAQECTKSPGTR